MKVLQLDALSVTLQGERRVDAVDFQLHAGEVAVIIGPNGAGKTTLLRAVIGEVAASAGAITLCGKPQSQWSLQERARHVAVLPQASQLNFPYRVAEVVALGRMPHSSGRRCDDRIVQQVMQALDIEHLRNRLYPRLSGGEKQRTQLARVLSQIWRAEDAGSRLLILDEPTAALDLGHQQSLMQTVREFARQGAGVLLVMHDINLALRYADHLLAMAGGRALAAGPVSEVLTETLLEKLFGVRVTLLHDSQHPHPVVVL